MTIYVQGSIIPSIIRLVSHFRLLARHKYSNRIQARLISVARIVVVDIAIVVHIAKVGSIARVRRTQPPIVAKPSA